MAKITRSGTYPVTERVQMKSELRTKPSVEAGIVTDETIGGVRLVEYQPGNGSRYVLTVSEVTSHPSLQSALGRVGRTAVVWVSNWDKGWATSVGSPDPVHWTAIQKRLSCSIFDAVVLAELLGKLLGRRAVSVEEFLADKTG